MEQIVMLRPDEWAKLKEELKSEVRNGIDQIKGLVVEKPLTFKEMADHLSITEDALRKRKLKGMHPELFHKKGGKIYGFASEINAYVRNKKATV